MSKPQNIQSIINAIQSHQYVHAHSLIDQMAQGQPANARLVYLRALIHLEQGDYELALEEADLAIELDERFASSYGIKASAAWGLGQKMKAQKAFEKGLELVGDVTEEGAHGEGQLLSAYAMFLSIERGAKMAKETVAQAVKAHPDEAATWVASAWLEVRQYRLSQAEVSIDRALEIAPRHQQALELKILILKKRDADEQASQLAKVLSEIAGVEVNAAAVEEELWAMVEAREEDLFRGFSNYKDKTESIITRRMIRVLVVLVLVPLMWVMVVRESFMILYLMLGVIGVGYIVSRVYRRLRM